MLRTVEDVEVVHQAASERAFGQHTLYGVADDAVSTEGALAQLCRCVEALSAGLNRVACVHLVGLLLAGEYDLCGVDEDYVVTAVYVRGEIWLVLSAQYLGYLGAKTAYDLVCSVDNDPLLINRFLVGGNSLVT